MAAATAAGTAADGSPANRGAGGHLWGLCGGTQLLVSRVFARIFVITSILEFSDDFNDFLENKLKTPILAESGERANPCSQDLLPLGEHSHHDARASATSFFPTTSSAAPSSIAHTSDVAPQPQHSAPAGFGGAAHETTAL